MIIIKPKTITIDAFTHLKAAHDFFPIDTANNFIPEWYKRTPKFGPNVPVDVSMVEVPMNTIRRCVGVIDYYGTTSFIIPLWSDLILDYGPDEFKHKFSDGVSRILYHNREMRGEYLKDFEHFKILSCWKLKEKTGVKFHFSQPFYNFDDPSKIIIPPGVVDYKYQHSTEINFFLKRPPTMERITLDAGQPVAMITPLTDTRIVFKHHLISFDEFEKGFSHFFSFTNIYNKAKKLTQIKEKRESKCPFHFKNK